MHILACKINEKFSCYEVSWWERGTEPGKAAFPITIKIFGNLLEHLKFHKLICFQFLQVNNRFCH